VTGSKHHRGISLTPLPAHVMGPRAVLRCEIVHTPGPLPTRPIPAREVPGFSGEGIAAGCPGQRLLHIWPAHAMVASIITVTVRLQEFDPPSGAAR
jgi:hypothetical protein